MVYFSNGGFSHSDVYNMPTYMRSFYYNQLAEMKKLEKKEMDKANKKPSYSKPSIPRK
tara:strand:+ start:621 stop:794 length:174 start_codon:yes stop_codon:yes gene_type:complete